MEEKQAFQAVVYKIVSGIPKGRVLTYGMVAVLAGRPQNARMVGRFLSRSPDGVPAHRVVNSQGRTAPGWTKQRILLEQEGVSFKENGCVDLANYRWKL